MAKKAKIQKGMSCVQDLYNYLHEACNKLRGPVSQDNFKEYITPFLYYKRISDVYDEETPIIVEQVVNDINNEVVNIICQFKDAFKCVTVRREIEKKLRPILWIRYLIN